MVISQGDVFWAVLPEPFAGERGSARPVVVIQSDAFNRAGINSVVVCHTTTNLDRAHSPGNVLLARREANLPKRSVVNITQITTVHREQLVEKIGTLSTGRLEEVLAGVRFLIQPMRGGG
jgi:mRNA interferase MazF